MVAAGGNRTTGRPHNFATAVAAAATANATTVRRRRRHRGKHHKARTGSGTVGKIPRPCCCRRLSLLQADQETGISAAGLGPSTAAPAASTATAAPLSLRALDWRSHIHAVQETTAVTLGLLLFHFLLLVLGSVVQVRAGGGTGFPCRRLVLARVRLR